ncbi:oxysterol-binding protein-related protein 4C [Diospyros lotus]|uniref:oxysterol-binding protein-related protein 4C n=1 Tax=Diospyros lotus TaxID=55363 RepID=UPI002254FABF|nr:oxysterol-binding protein-related protein 4C [Diospyros lotus]
MCQHTMVQEGKMNSNGREGKARRVAVVTSPLKLEGDSSDGDDYRVPNLLHRVLSLLKNVHPGTDLIRFQVPPVFNIPKSMLQCYGEPVYCVGKDLLGACANGQSSVDRFLSVVAWNISTLRPLMFGVAPYNPVLGETHHVSRGTLNVLLEQVSHHPPVSALHATDEQNGIEMIWCHHLAPKYNGTSVETRVHGERQLKLLNKGEIYEIGHPNLVIRFLPVPGVHWVGNVTIRCRQTGLEAMICFGGSSFLGLKPSNRSVKGTVFISSSRKPIYDITGHWDRTVTVKDAGNGKSTVIYDARDVLSRLRTPIVKDPEGVSELDSTMVWGEVSENILSKCWEKAREAKTEVEEKERELLRARNGRAEIWLPKHFTVSHTPQTGWQCSPVQNRVPPAPIVVPL